PNVAEVMHVIGDVQGKSAILIDDIVDTGGTLVQAAEALLEHGAQEVYACATHPVLSDPGAERLQASPIKEIVVTNTIPLRVPKIRVLSIAPLFAEAIRRIFEEISVSKLFEV